MKCIIIIMGMCLKYHVLPPSKHIAGVICPGFYLFLFLRHTKIPPAARTAAPAPPAAKYFV